MNSIYISRAFQVLVVILVFSSAILPAQTRTARVELRLTASEMVDGVPDVISFVFVNHGRYEVRVPPVSGCIGRYSGTISLRLRFSPVLPRGNGVGGGCGGGIDHVPPI